jgi:flagellar basal body-associated protein FliL
MAEKEPVERLRQEVEYDMRPSLLTLKNIFILLAGVVISSALALFTVGNYIAPKIESRKAEHESLTFSKGSDSELEDLVFYKIDPVIVNPAGSNGERYLKAAVSLEAYDPAIIAEVEKRLPQIKNQINIILSSKTIEQVQTNEDKERLRREIQSRINGLLTTGNISNVYFEEFVYQ